MDHADALCLTDAIDYSALFQAAPSPFMILDRELRYLDANECYLQVVGATIEDLRGRFVFDVFPETDERREKFGNAFRRALEGEANTLRRELYQIPDGQGGKREIWWTCHHIPVVDREGRVRGVLQKALDVTAEVKAERMRDTVLREIDHRMKNQLATISAIARRTARDAATTNDFLESFDRRLQAMSRTHQMLVDEEWGGLQLGDLIRAELAPYRDGDDTRIRTEGPAVTLSPGEAQSLGLALHELATNAAKYGGLSEDGESLAVAWRQDERGVELTWAERGRRAILQPSRQGFGSVIVDRLLPSQIGATVQRDYRADGLHCRIAIPRGDAGTA